MTSGSDQGRRQGVLLDWNDERGFGFVAPAAGGPRLFVHVSAFPRGRRPVSGCTVTYTEGQDERGRPRALDVRYLTPVRGGSRRRRGVTGSLVVAGLVAAVLGVLLAKDEIPAWLLIVYAVLSLVAVLLYADDKSAAEKGERRTTEARLLFVGLIGGWPGALVARHAFRHKTRKQPFRTVFWLTVVLNCAGLAWLVVAGPDLSWR